MNISMDIIIVLSIICGIVVVSIAESIRCMLLSKEKQTKSKNDLTYFKDTGIYKLVVEKNKYLGDRYVVYNAEYLNINKKYAWLPFHILSPRSDYIKRMDIDTQYENIDSDNRKILTCSVDDVKGKEVLTGIVDKLNKNYRGTDEHKIFLSKLYDMNRYSYNGYM